MVNSSVETFAAFAIPIMGEVNFVMFIIAVITEKRTLKGLTVGDGNLIFGTLT